MSAVNVSVQDGIEFQEFKARMEGFAAGAVAAAQEAISLRMSQLAKSTTAPLPTAEIQGRTPSAESTRKESESISTETANTSSPDREEACRPVLVDTRSAS